jgi:methylenetetrahydrofolate dehydrogenase (NADP+)/methenyltetrahydrofolate cyclohydrolase
MMKQTTPANILDGTKLAEQIRSAVKSGVEELRAFGVETGLAVLLVGDNPASKQYLAATVRAAGRCGVQIYKYDLPATASVNTVLNIAQEINRDERINGLLMLMPLPGSMNSRRAVNAIAPNKDVDGIGAISLGRLAADESTYQLFGELKGADGAFVLPDVTGFLPCTPFGVMRLLEYNGISVKGKHAVIIGKSFAVGKPLSLMMLAKEATVTVCHRETRDLAHFTRQADILCTATGRAGLIAADMVKPGAVVVDIGINVRPDGVITGDVDFPAVAQVASWITPVPGGVGPVTISMLLENTLQSARRSERQHSPFMVV